MEVSETLTFLPASSDEETHLEEIPVQEKDSPSPVQKDPFAFTDSPPPPPPPFKSEKVPQEDISDPAIQEILFHLKCLTGM